MRSTLTVAAVMLLLLVASPAAAVPMCAASHTLTMRSTSFQVAPAQSPNLLAIEASVARLLLLAACEFCDADVDG